MANIVHFGKYYYPDRGGIESVTSSLARGGVRSGHSVSVVSFKNLPTNVVDLVEGVVVYRAPIDVIVASQPLSFSYVFNCCRVARKADVVHLHAPNMLGALCALFVGEGARLLVHWHSDVVNKGFLGRIFLPLELALLRRADAIVVATSVYAEASRVLAPFARKTTVIPYGVSVPAGELVNAEVRIPFEYRLQGKKIILAVGRLIPYKGFDVLIKAARYISADSVVVIVGAGPLESELQKLMNEDGVGDQVVLAGRLGDAELQLLFKKAALFCLPSTYRAEAFGVVLIEAMAHGLPIVACNIPGSGVPWVNQHGISGFNVPVGNAKALAEACNQILGSEELRSRLSQGARSRFLAEFREEVSVERMMAAYDDLLAS